MNKFRSLAALTLLLIISFSLSGCGLVDSTLVKLGFRNTDFEYIKNNKVDKIVIQNTRDSGFRFVVTENYSIKEIYNSLASGDPTDEKTSLAPDYIFEIYTGDEVKKYNYVVGVTERGKGNFYNDEKAYSVPKNLDQTLIQNLSFIRKPRDFNEIYYDSILKVVEQKANYFKENNLKVGIDISTDVDCLKYMFSVQLNDFERELKALIPNVGFVNSNPEEFDVVITPKNRGFNNTLFKTVITVDNKKSKEYETFYVTGEIPFRNWEIKISEPNKKPNDW